MDLTTPVPHLSGITWYLSFVPVISLNEMSSGSSTCGMLDFPCLLKAEWYSVVCIYYVLFICGHAFCLWPLAVVNNAAKNIWDPALIFTNSSLNYQMFTISPGTWDHYYILVFQMSIQNFMFTSWQSRVWNAGFPNQQFFLTFIYFYQFQLMIFFILVFKFISNFTHTEGFKDSVEYSQFTTINSLSLCQLPMYSCSAPNSSLSALSVVLNWCPDVLPLLPAGSMQINSSQLPVPLTRHGRPWILFLCFSCGKEILPRIISLGTLLIIERGTATLDF